MKGKLLVGAGGSRRYPLIPSVQLTGNSQEDAAADRDVFVVARGLRKIRFFFLRQQQPYFSEMEGKGKEKKYRSGQFDPTLCLFNIHGRLSGRRKIISE